MADMHGMCFAYSKEGQRCQLDADHEADHQIKVTWTDEECWTPDTQPKPRPAKATRPTNDSDEVEHLVDVDMKPRCEICSHPAEHHANSIGECAACDCKSYLG